MTKPGNNLWWSQVQDLHHAEGGTRHYKETEIEVFYRLYKVMKEDGMKQAEIQQHFKEVFGIGYSAFYSRLRKMGVKYVAR